MNKLAIKKEVLGSVEDMVKKVTMAIKEIGFGVLTRIDFDQKIQEKLGETIPPTVVLGACNPKLAYLAYQQTTDIALLLPCNVVVRQSSPEKVVIEVVRPTALMAVLPNLNLKNEVSQIEDALEKTIASL